MRESYREVVSEVRRVLTVEEVAAVVGATGRAVQKWAAGDARPGGQRRVRLLDLQYVVCQLDDVYEVEGSGIWLRSPNRLLGGRRPLDVVGAGEVGLVLALVDRLAGGPVPEVGA